jgi:type IV fimbrial biogenesis protein FimT
MEGPRPHGYTLIETLVALAMVGVLAGWALPGMRDLAQNAARTQQVNAFLQAVYLARSEAIKRNAVVSLCPSPDGAVCVPGTDWHGGWIVFANLDRDSPAVRDAGEDLLTAYPPWQDGRIDTNRSTLSFRAFGQSGVTATVTFCDSRGSRSARAVIISQTGRPRVTDRSSTGGALSCD